MVKNMIKASKIFSLFFITIVALVGRESNLSANYSYSSIKSITIQYNGAWDKDLSSSDETVDDCAKFRLTEKDIIEFFKHADRTNFSMWNYLPFSRCYSSGSIIFNNGDKGTWFIDKNRRATIVLSNGLRGYFYGKRASAKVFAEASPYFDNPLYDVPQKNKSRVPKKLASIKSISFRRTNLEWYASSIQKSGNCRFELQEGEVREFFMNAKRVTQEALWKLPTSNCHVEGEIEFSDGKRGSWMIKSGRTGVIQIDEEKLLFYWKDATSSNYD